MAKEPDIRLLFGVDGGGSISEGSGKKIEEDLLKIVEAINGKNEMKIKFGVDDESIKEITAKIQKAMSGISVDISKIGVSSGANEAMSGLSLDNVAASAASNSQVIKKNADEVVKALKQIETQMHQLEVAEQKAMAFDNGKSTGGAINEINALRDSLKEIGTELFETDIKTDQFASRMQEIGLKVKVTTDVLSEYIAQEKAEAQAASIAAKEILNENEALVKIQRQRATMNKTLTGISDIGDLGVADGGRQSLYEQLKSLSDLENKVRSGTISSSEFAQSLSNISVESQRAKDSISNYVAAQNKLVDNAAAIQKINAETAKLTTALQNVKSVDLSVTNKDASEQIEYLKLGLEDLNRLKEQVASGTMTKSEFSKMLSDITEVTGEASSKLKIYVQESKDAAAQTLDVTNALSKIQSLENSIRKTRSSAEGFDLSSSAAGNDFTLATQLSNLAALRDEVFSKSITKNEFEEALNNITLDAKKAQDSLSGFVAEQKKAIEEQKKLVDTTTALTSLESTRHEVEAAIQKATNFGDEAGTAGFVSQLQDARAEYDKLKQAVEAGGMTTEEFTKRNNELTRSYKEVKNQLSEYIEKKKQEERLDDRILVDSKAYVTANKQIEDSLREVMDAQAKFGSSTNKNIQADVSALGAYRQKLDELYAKLQTGTLTQTEFNHSVQELQGDIRGTISSLNSYESPLQRMKDNLSSVTKQFAGFYTAHQIVSKSINAIRNMINNSVELESAFADTRIVTQATEEEFKNYANTITDTAQQVAAPIESLVSATTTFARLGYSLEDSQALAKFTGMLEKVGDIDSKSAEDAITSILKAFPDEANINTIESIMDRLVTTGKVVARVCGNTYLEIGYNGQSRFGISA